MIRAPTSSSGDDAFCDRRFGGVHGIFDTRLLLFHLGVSCRADFDHGHASEQFGEPFLQLLAIVIGGCPVRLRTKLLDACLDCRRLASTFDDGGVILVDGDLPGASQVFDLDILQLDAEIFAEQPSAREHGDVLEDFFSPFTVAGGFHRRYLQRAAQLVDDQ